MTTAATPAPTAVAEQPATPFTITPAHREVFQKARDKITETYGKSPTDEELMRMWLTGASPYQIMRFFEESVLKITGSDLAGTAEDENQVLLNI
jgi:DNA-binding PadR family transcriptional regulator